MSNPEQRFGAYAQLTFEMGADRIPLNASVRSSFVVEDWKANQFASAVEPFLPDACSEEAEREIDEIGQGCQRLADRTTRYEPYQENTELTLFEARIVRLLGAERFLEIYRQPPPAELIDYMLSEDADRITPPSLASISALVANGVLEWQDRFTDAGVVPADEFIEREIAQQKESRARMEALHKKRLSLGQLALRSLRGWFQKPEK